VRVQIRHGNVAPLRTQSPKRAQQDAAVAPEQQREIAALHQVGDASANFPVERRDAGGVSNNGGWPFEIAVRRIGDDVADVDSTKLPRQTQLAQCSRRAINRARAAIRVGTQPECGWRTQER
jgi:hypothetical protein